MDLIAVDFETFYSKELGFKSHTTEEYVRHDDFHVIGVSVALNNSDPVWFSGNDEETYQFLTQFPWASSAVLAHNTKFDGAILSWRYGFRAKAWLDTLCMARALHGVEVGGSLAALAEWYGLGKKGTEVVNALGLRRVDFPPEQLAAYGQYCCNDVVLTRSLFYKLMKAFPKIELKVIDVTLRMFIEPTLVLNKPLLEQHLIEVIAQKEKLLALIEVDKAAIMSNDKFAQALIDLGVQPPRKISTRTGKSAWAFAKTDEGFKELVYHPDPRVQALVAARLGVKTTLEETRTKRLIGIAERGLLPAPIKYYAAHTGRWGGCLVADTEVIVYNSFHGVETKRIVDVLLDDLVWDGEEFVAHEGVQLSGFSEVIEWDGVQGTDDHVVFTEIGEISLYRAMQGQHRIKVAGSHSQNDVDAARLTSGANKA